ncbi:MAG TPA: PGPGW domain-containing protein [Actinomycetales bacterium]|nr:PGPGW domain-containing protein [Actinomycetales bacterium]
MDTTRGTTDASAEPAEGHDHGDVPVLLDAKDDRWEWRRRIRADPRKRRIYRGAVGFLGLLLILLAGATGWLPGPGGIPLALIGLAVLASEFEWAQRLLEWAKDRVRELAHWTGRQPVWVRALGGVFTVACIAVAVWFSLRLFGIPGFAPDGVTNFLTGVPGLG